MTKVFVVRSESSFDGPEIEFITSDENIAKKVLEANKRAKYEESRKSDLSWVNSRKAKYNHSKLLASDPKTKEILGEEEYKYLLDEIEREKVSWEHSLHKLKLTFEEWSENYGKNWFYEEVDLIDSLQEALSLEQVTARYPSRKMRKRNWG